MSQSSIIAGAFMFAFLVYITAKGELSTYLSFFGIAPGQTQSGSGSGSSGGIGGISLGSLSGSSFGGLNVGSSLGSADVADI